MGRDDEDPTHAVCLAAAEGITNLGGHLAGGITSSREERRPTEATERIEVATRHERIDDLRVGHLHRHLRP